MDEFTVILLLTGSAGAAIIVALAQYWGFFGTRRTRIQISANVEAIKLAEASLAANSNATSSAQTHHEETTISEAPAPFFEDNAAARTSVPTDVSAITGINTTIAHGVGPVLVIAKPKRRTRAKRLPSTTTAQTTPRRRRTAKQPSAVPDASGTAAVAIPTTATTHPEVDATGPAAQQ
jgi:hypothetical protein